MDIGAAYAAATPRRRFKAFLSYSRKDDRIAKWLHASLEAYRTPKELLSGNDAIGPVAKRLSPVFRDRTDLSSGGELTDKLVEALRQSEFLIILCSPASAQSAYVNAEVEAFIKEDRAANIMPVIVLGKPNSGDAETECLPPALKSLKLLASDLRDERRKDGKRVGDGREGGKFKLIAGMLGVPLDTLLQRERKREARRAVLSAVASIVFLGLAVTAAGAAYIAYQNELEARRQTAAAEASADFLVSTFEVAIPAQENPNTITARTILDRGAARIGQEFARQPGIKVRLVDAIARAYSHLGLIEEARSLIEHDLATMRATGADGVQGLLTLAHAYAREGQHERALAMTYEAERQLAQASRNRPELSGYVHETRAVVQYSAADAAAALNSYERALQEYRRARDPDPRDIARVLNNTGSALSDVGRYAEAERALLEANNLYARHSGDRSLFVGQNLYVLALNASYSEDYAAAESYATRADTILSAVLDAGNPILGDLCALRGQIKIENGDYAGAIGDLERAISTYDSSFPGADPSTGIAQYYLASAYLGQNQIDRALIALDEAKANYDSAFEQDNPNQGDLLVQRSVVLLAAGRAEEARQACAAGLRVIAVALGEDSVMYQEDRARCAPE